MTTYAFVSHESAVTANWAIARRGIQLLDDEGVWLIPAPKYCVHTQRQVAELAASVDLAALGIANIPGATSAATCTAPIHLLCPSATSRSRGQLATFHVWKDFFPEHAFLRVHERVFVSSPLFTVLQLAVASRPSRRTRQRATTAAETETRIRLDLGLQAPDFSDEDLLVWEGIERLATAIKALTDFSGTYRLPSRPGEKTLYQQPPLVRFADMRTYLAAEPAMRGAKKVREVLSRAFEGSASPMETALALMLTLPVEMGGFGLPRPTLNRQVFVEPEDRELTAADELYGDLSWAPEKSDAHDGPHVIVEYDGYENHEARGSVQLDHDRERANSLTALGWDVLSVSDAHVTNLRRLSRLAAQVARLLGVKLRQPNELELVWRTRLHALLLGKTDPWR